MSFFKKLFGGGGEPAAAEPKVAGEAEHRGFIIKATPFKNDGQYQTCGVISKEIGGEVKEHRFIRADRFAGLDDVVQLTLSKGRQIIDEQGERLFG
ncbi:MAG: HlyU family transcriptional regulator [Mesorhizobium sp.]